MPGDSQTPTLLAPSTDRLVPKRVVTASLADQVWKHLWTAIIFGQVQAGERLVELRIASQMGTSQGPVREALLRLERDGLVERRGRSGTFVTDIVVDDINELFSVRRLVEKLAMQRTAQIATAAQCDLLQDVVDEMHRAAQSHDSIMLDSLNMDFHRHICQWSGSRALLRIWMPLFAQIQRLMVHLHLRRDSETATFSSAHQPIVDALRRNDADQAVRLIEEHIAAVWDRIRSE